ncbi:MAG: hypothetical protein HF962_02510 [Sulfurovum sp.]|nr:hypothetical protein [Sulfurovum sp.]
MKKIIILLNISFALLFAATPEQVERYISLSQAEEELLELESSFSAMQSKVSAKDTNSSTYDTELLSIRFREHLQKTLSENEMEKVLENYKNEILLKFVSATNDPDRDPYDAMSYVKKLKTDASAQIRIGITEKINKIYSNKEAMYAMINTLIEPMMKTIQTKASNDKNVEKMKKTFVDRVVKKAIEDSNNEILYATREFTIKELEELLKIAKTPATGYEIKALYDSVAFAMQELVGQMASQMEYISR